MLITHLNSINLLLGLGRPLIYIFHVFVLVSGSPLNCAKHPWSGLGTGDFSWNSARAISVRFLASRTISPEKSSNWVIINVNKRKGDGQKHY